MARCIFRRLWDDLDSDDQTTLTEWIDRGFGTPRIRQGLIEAGLTAPGGSGIDKHLKGACCCTGDDPLKGVRGGSAKR